MSHHAGKLSLALLTMIVASGCSEKYVIVPGEVEAASTGSLAVSDGPGGPLDHRTLSGSFRIEASTAIGAIESARVGGGCLLADLNHLNIPDKAEFAATGGSCSTDSDCHNAIPAADRAKGFWGYCVTERKETTTKDGVVPAKRACWTRPGPQSSYCNVGPAVRETGKKLPIPVTAGSARPYPLHEGGVRWRVRACLNGGDGEAGKPPCAGYPGTKLVVDGPVFVLPVPPKFTPPPKVMPPKALPKKPGGA